MFSVLQKLSPIDANLTQLRELHDRILRIDSRKVEPGDIFIACRGEYTDGRSYIQSAINRGAACIFWDDDGHFLWQPEWSVCHIPIQNLSERVGMLASAYYEYPGNQLYLVGVTGTNGKTSISQWLAQCFDLLGKKCGIMGTVGNGYWHHLQPATHTTPDAVSLQGYLKQFVQEGAQAVAMEVSSHGLAQNRVVGVPFTTAVFTNLTRDHLDYHGDMQNYAESKMQLFYWQGLKHAIINIDDEFGRVLAANIRRDRLETEVYSYGFSHDADIRITEFQVAYDGMTLSLSTPWGQANIHSRLWGRFNALNLAACVGVLCSANYSLAEVVSVVSQIQPAVGRMDCIAQEGAPLVVIDYAHTPDALEKVLLTLKEMKEEGTHLWCVFGCGGNRDRGKRSIMGSIASEHADCVVITSDNPRMEDPHSIIEDILTAVPNPVLVDANRQTAIQYAIHHAKPRDIILIAGKGHETYQEIDGDRHHFSDFEEAEAALDTYLTYQ